MSMSWCFFKLRVPYQMLFIARKKTTDFADVAQMSSLLCVKLRMRDRLRSRLSVAPTLNGQPHHAQDSALYSSSETQVKDNGRTCLSWVETSAGAKRLNLRTFKTSACRCKERWTYKYTFKLSASVKNLELKFIKKPLKRAPAWKKSQYFPLWPKYSP